MKRIYITEPPNQIIIIIIIVMIMMIVQTTHSPLQNSTANSFSTSPMILPGRAATTPSSLTLLGCTILYITTTYFTLAVFYAYHCRVLSHSLQYITIVFWCTHRTHVWVPIRDIVSAEILYTRRTHAATHHTHTHMQPLTTHTHARTHAHTHTPEYIGSHLSVQYETAHVQSLQLQFL